MLKFLQYFNIFKNPLKYYPSIISKYHPDIQPNEIRLKAQYIADCNGTNIFKRPAEMGTKCHLIYVVE